MDEDSAGEKKDPCRRCMAGAVDPALRSDGNAQHTRRLDTTNAAKLRSTKAWLNSPRVDRSMNASSV